MKKIVCLSLFLLSLSLFLTCQVYAYPVTVGAEIKFQNGLYGTTPGGEFNIIDASTGDRLFETFCLEYNEHLNYSSIFVVDSISSIAYGGGTDNDSPNIPGDPISDETKWLYWNFVTGTLESLTDYTYSDTGINALQRAIWFLEDELGSTSDTIAKSLINAAEAAVDAGSFLGDVKVMNISFKNGGFAQSQLIAAAPVPEPSTLVLMGAGGGLLWLVRRRNERK